MRRRLRATACSSTTASQGHCIHTKKRKGRQDSKSRFTQTITKAKEHRKSYSPRHLHAGWTMMEQGKWAQGSQQSPWTILCILLVTHRHNISDLKAKHRKKKQVI